MIVQIGEWVIFKACLQMKRWHNQFPQYQNLYLNINISGKQFIHPNFIPHLNKVINDTGLKPKNICLEITETVLIENRSLANDIFKSLHKMGFEIQIDDFGTGYSSMGYLQDFPVDTIKIDRTFIRSMGMEEKGSQIVQAIITMAHQMGMNVIAEGIETGEQLHFLQSMSCKFGQGFYLSHPLPSTEIDLLIRSEQHESKTKLQ
jgi:EAL domain-containing protein (putative c-di-GMP-specific phosphodiesterase class I)